MSTTEGDVSIATIEEGDRVLAWNETTNETGYYEVTATFSHLDPVLTELIINGEWIETTPEHPFYVEGKGWTPAGDLKFGDQIRQADGTFESVWLKWDIQKYQEMYNLTVDEAHTFFVGEGQWLVHNSGCNPKIFGEPQKTYTYPKGIKTETNHAADIQSLANQLTSNMDDIAEIHYHRQLSSITGNVINSKLKPDIALKFNDGSYSLYERISSTQTYADQLAKLRDMGRLFTNKNLVIKKLIAW